MTKWTQVKTEENKHTAVCVYLCPLVIRRLVGLAGSVGVGNERGNIGWVLGLVLVGQRDHLHVRPN